MTIKVSSRQLDRLRGKDKEESKTPTKSEPKTQVAQPRTDLDQVVKAAEAAASAARSNQLTTSELVSAMNDLPARVDRSPSTARLVVVRDSQGLIDYIDVVHKL